MASQSKAGSLIVAPECSFNIKSEFYVFILLVDKRYVGVPVLFFRKYYFITIFFRKL